VNLLCTVVDMSRLDTYSLTRAVVVSECSKEVKKVRRELSG